jgi:hypothetical protein
MKRRSIAPQIIGGIGGINVRLWHKADQAEPCCSSPLLTQSGHSYSIVACKLSSAADAQSLNADGW